jgi:hypothetical protein
MHSWVFGLLFYGGGVWGSVLGTTPGPCTCFTPESHPCSCSFSVSVFCSSGTVLTVKVPEFLSQCCEVACPKTEGERDLKVTQVLEHLPTKHKALN